MEAFWVSLAVVFVAELGDKSQLMALAFATRYRAAHVIVAIVGATAVMMLGAVLVGNLLSAALPTRILAVAAGVAFLGFAIWTLVGRDDDDPPGSGARVTEGRSPVLGIGLAFLVAELGDKTMLATITLAATGSWIGVWLGSTLGMAGASVLAVAVGNRLGARLPTRLVRIGAAALFAVFGVIMVVQGLRG